jgi:hypothetical protein
MFSLSRDMLVIRHTHACPRSRWRTRVGWDQIRRCRRRSDVWKVSDNNIISHQRGARFAMKLIVADAVQKLQVGIFLTLPQGKEGNEKHSVKL